MIRQANAKGEVVNNLVGLKPILNETNEYLFAIVLHFDVTEVDLEQRARQHMLLEKLLKELPDVVMKNRDEEIDAEQTRQANLLKKRRSTVLSVVSGGGSCSVS